MPDASPANGRPATPDQPTTDLNRIWARPAAEDGAAAQEWGNGSAYVARSEAEPTAESERTTNESTAGSESAPKSKTHADPKAQPKTEPSAEATGDDQQETAATAPTGDRVGFRLAAFGALLVVVLFAGYGLGRLNNGGTTSASAPAAPAATAGGSMPGMGENQPHTHGAGTMTMGAAIGGLSLSGGGLTLVPARTAFLAGQPQRLSFRITGPG